MKGDLTTYARACGWLGLTPLPDPASPSGILLTRLITASSRFVMNYIQRDTLAPMAVTDNYDGNGKNFLVLRQWPVITLANIQFCGVTIDTPAAGNPLSSGYLVEPADSSGGSQQRLTIFGYCFPYGRSLVFVTYTFGYQIVGEAYAVPAGTPPTLTTDSMWLSDLGVTYANGTPLTNVASSPAAGQYSVAAGIYTFNATDIAAEVLISYGFVPADIEQAAIELIGEAYRRKERIGEVSKSLGGQETVSFSQKDMHDATRLALQPYCRVAPV